VHFLHYMFRPLLVAIFRWFVIQKILRQLPHVSTDPLLQYYKILYTSISDSLVLYFIFYGTLIVKYTEATDPLTHAVTAFEFFVLQTT
jgi:hypothetical protein